MTIGERIKIVRKQCGEKGITQKELGSMCGIDAANIRKYESNRQNPKIETVTKIADALNVPTSLLMGEQPFPDPFLEEPKALISVCEAINDYHHIMISDLPFVERIRIIEELVAEINFLPDPNISMDEIAASVVIFKDYVIDTNVDVSKVRNLSEIDDPDELKKILLNRSMFSLQDKLKIWQLTLENASLNNDDYAELTEHEKRLQIIKQKAAMLSEKKLAVLESLLDALTEDEDDTGTDSPKELKDRDPYPPKELNARYLCPQKEPQK